DLGTEFGHSARAVKAEWPKARITGVEVHAPTLEACCKDAGEHYRETVLADAREFLWRPDLGGQKKWDVVLAAEIVEHLPKEDRAKYRGAVGYAARRLALVPSPIAWQLQGAIYDNPHE